MPSPASCTHAPPAPLPSAAFRRRPLPGPALTGPRPTVTRSQGARHAAPPSLPRAAARSHRTPSPEYHPAAARTFWTRLARIALTACRRPHRIYPTACRHPHPPMSPPSRFRAHRPPSRPPCADIRVTPPSLSSRCVGPGVLAGKNRTVCIPFSSNARKRPPSWQHPPEMHAFRDQDGNILALCIHSRAQSGDSGYMACESCRQGPTFASRNPKSRMTRRCCQRRAAFPRQRPAVRPNGLCVLLSRFAIRGPPRGLRTDTSRYLRAAPTPPAARAHRVQETSGTAQTTQCEHKNRIPK